MYKLIRYWIGLGGTLEALLELSPMSSSGEWISHHGGGPVTDFLVLKVCQLD